MRGSYKELAIEEPAYGNTNFGRRVQLNTDIAYGHTVDPIDIIAGINRAYAEEQLNREVTDCLTLI